MRIIGGARRGAKLEAPEGSELRPTADRVREAVFNILIHGIEGGEVEEAVVLDLFAGTGAMGLEALSRGAAHVTFVENDEAALRILRANVRKLDGGAATTVLRHDATRLGRPPLAAQTPARLAFLDPPYRSGLAAPALTTLAANGWLAEGAVCVVETGAKEDVEPPAGYALIDERRYGAAKVTFLRKESF